MTFCNLIIYIFYQGLLSPSILVKSVVANTMIIFIQNEATYSQIYKWELSFDLKGSPVNNAR